jgi:AbiV family abortive infection protein
MGIFPIPWEETLEGCRLSIENAERLVEDSLVLRGSGRLQSAYSVSLDAWEELGKAILLYRFFSAKEPVLENDWKRILTDHKSKRVAFVNNVDLLYGPAPTKSVTELKDSLKDALKERADRSWFSLEREVGVYVDWVGGEDRWRSPCRIDEWWFASIPFDARYWANSAKAICRRLKELTKDSDAKATSSS